MNDGEEADQRRWAAAVRVAGVGQPVCGVFVRWLSTGCVVDCERRAGRNGEAKQPNGFHVRDASRTNSNSAAAGGRGNSGRGAREQWSGRGR